MTLEECRAHVPGLISKDIESYVIDELFLKQRYIFTWRENSKQFGYCSHCHHEFRNIYTMTHKSTEKCPHCGSECIVRASGRGLKSMVDNAYFVFYQKSQVDPNAITAVGLRVVRDYRNGFRFVECKYEPVDMFVFIPGQRTTMFHQSYCYGSNGWERSFQPQKGIACQYNRDENLHIMCGYSRKSLEQAVAGTPFRYSTWEQYDQDDMIAFMDLFARYPCVEYLTKLGLKELVKSKLMGWRTYQAINWRGKTLQAVLKMSKQELASARGRHKEITFWVLNVLQMSRKDGSNFTVAEAISAAKASYDLERIKELQRTYKLREILLYIGKQQDKYGYRIDLSTWRDYLKECAELGFDLNDERVKFPKNLYNAHQSTLKQIKYKRDEAFNQKIKHRAKSLKHLKFTLGNLLIRPAESTDELIEEGKALSHCVGGYANRYADGSTIICFVRKRSEPEKPFMTMEIRKSEIIQCRGLKNWTWEQLNEPEVGLFIEAYKRRVLKRKQKAMKEAV